MKALLIFLAFFGCGHAHACASFRQCKKVIFLNDTAQGFRKEAPTEVLKVADFMPTLLLYPNPASQWLRADINLPSATQVAEMIMLNAQGIRVGRYHVPEHRSSIEINVSGLPAGLYYCVLYADGFTSASVKLVIE